MGLPEVKNAKPEDKVRILSAASLAFCADPFMRWVLPEPEAYLKKYADMIDLYCCQKSLENASTFVVQKFGGVALWLPPGVHSDEEKVSGWITDNIDPVRLDVFGQVLREMESYHPKTASCWYLAVLAVDPAFQRQGLGSVLMKHVNRILDETSCEGYLESSNPQNVSLYQRHGYEIMGEIKIGDCPVVTPMLRRPAS